MFYGSGGSERGNISDIRDLINIEMPQLQEALAPKAAPAQVVQFYVKLQFRISKWRLMMNELFATGLVMPVLHLH